MVMPLRYCSKVSTRTRGPQLPGNTLTQERNFSVARAHRDAAAHLAIHQALRVFDGDGQGHFGGDRIKLRWIEVLGGAGSGKLA
jgi:hypothetical protein